MESSSSGDEVQAFRDFTKVARLMDLPLHGSSYMWYKEDREIMGSLINSWYLKTC